MEAKLLHTEEVAKVLGVSRRTANDLMRTMPCVNIGTSTTRPHLAVLEPDLDAWIQSRGRCASLPRKSGRLAEGEKPRQSCSLWTGCWMRTGG